MSNTKVEKKYFINVNPNGTFGPYKPSPIGPVISKVQTSYSDVDTMFDNIKNEKRKHIALFFHGGLVGESNGMEAAERFYKFYNDINEVYPISFVWETGPVSAVIEYAKEEFDDSLFQSVFSDALSRISKKLKIDIPEMKSDNSASSTLSTKADKSIKLESKQEKIEISIANYRNLSLAEIEKDLLADANPDEKKLFTNYEVNKTTGTSNKGILKKLDVVWAGIKIATRCIYRFARKRGHGIVGTVLEETYRQIKIIDVISLEKTTIGVWNQMKRQAALMWQSNDYRKGDEQYAGRYFLDRLSEYIKDMQNQGDNVTIELVAHSAGSIVICELFDMLRKNQNQYEHIVFNNVIFMAPAVKCDLFYDTVMSMSNRYKLFRMYTMHKKNELEDRLINKKYLHWVYPHSLLYLVSGICEDGDKWFDEDVKGDSCLLGLEQHINGEHPYTKYGILEEIHKFLFENNRIVLTPTSEDAPIGY